MFVTAKDRQGQVIALLPLGIERHGNFRCVSFLGGKESNFNLGLFRPNAGLCADDLHALLQATAKALGPDAPDVFVLQNQPFAWEQVPNPFALLSHQTSPSFAYGTRLPRDGEEFLADRLSKAARKKLRKKEIRLAAHGPLAVIDSESPGTRHKILDAFFNEKTVRCEEQAIEADFTSAAVHEFFDRLTRPTRTSASWLEFYALTAGDRVVATYAGAVHRGHFSAMVNSFDTDPEIARSSPGELLLAKVIARQCERGIASFDLGIGEARYKSTYCNLTMPLFDVVVALTPKGQVFAAFRSLGSRLKATAKQNPRLVAALRECKRSLSRLQRKLLASPGRSAPRA